VIAAYGDVVVVCGCVAVPVLVVCVADFFGAFLQSSTW
jgi:hypothetical protein